METEIEVPLSFRLKCYSNLSEEKVERLKKQANLYGKMMTSIIESDLKIYEIQSVIGEINNYIKSYQDNIKIG